MKYLNLILGILLISCSSNNSPTDIHIKSRDKIENVTDQVVEIPMEDVLISGYANICLQNEYLILNSAIKKIEKIQTVDTK